MKKCLKAMAVFVLSFMMVLTMSVPGVSVTASAGGRGDSSMALGSDISAAATNNTYYNDVNGESRPLYDICKKDYGMNTVRLRTWVNHRSGQCSEDAIIQYAKQCSDAGLRVMIDFHYADDWADPGKQPPPGAWNVTDDISMEEAQRVGKELYDYTYNFLIHMKEAGVTPEWVQVGNEITNGFLWPLCNISNFDNFVYVLKQGIQAVRDASPETKVVLHIDNGANTETVTEWYRNIVAAGVDFDVMGLSFYPRDNDPTVSIESLANTFDSLYNEFCVGTDREIMVVEIGANYLDNATENQKYNMLVNVIHELEAVPDGRGTGCIYWEIENYEMEGSWGDRRPNEVWKAFSPGAELKNDRPVTGISLAEGDSLTLQQNDIYQMTLQVTPDSPDITRMVWSSSDPEVCTVTNSGQVKAIKQGEATITVTNYAGDGGEYETYTCSCTITVIPEQPGLKNGGFELGDDGRWQYAENNKGTPTLGTSSNAMSGSCSLHFTGGSEDLDFTFYQDIENLVPGKYRLTGYVMGDSGVTDLNLFAVTTDQEYISDIYQTIGWGGSGNFVEMTLDDIEVIDGKLRVGAHAEAVYKGSEAWGDFDNFTLELVEAYESQEEEIPVVYDDAYEALVPAEGYEWSDCEAFFDKVVKVQVNGTECGWNDIFDENGVLLSDAVLFAEPGTYEIVMEADGYAGALTFTVLKAEAEEPENPDTPQDPENPGQQEDSEQPQQPDTSTDVKPGQQPDTGGQSANTTVTGTEDQKASPQTGDQSNAFVFAGILAGSAAVAGVVIKQRKRINR